MPHFEHENEHHSRLSKFFEAVGRYAERVHAAEHAGEVLEGGLALVLFATASVPGGSTPANPCPGNDSYRVEEAVSSESYHDNGVPSGDLTVGFMELGDTQMFHGPAFKQPVGEKELLLSQMFPQMGGVSSICRDEVVSVENEKKNEDHLEKDRRKVDEMDAVQTEREEGRDQQESDMPTAAVYVQIKPPHGNGKGRTSKEQKEE